MPTTPSQSPGRAALRKLLNAVLTDSVLLDAFCIDRFPDVARQLGAGMDTLSKMNLLLMRADPNEIYKWLCVDYPAALLQQGQFLDERTEEEPPTNGALTERLDRLYQARDAAVISGKKAPWINEQIRQIKREQRQHGPQLTEGEVLGDRYRLCQLIGRGGMSNVWLAWDRKMTLFVAVKVLHSQWGPQQPQWHRFRRGARHMAKLSLRHPGFVRVLSDDLARDSGFYYFVMEYLSGGDLHKAVIHRKLSEKEGITAILQVAAALHFAHDQRLIHRDVKPQNILLDADGRARLSDFDLVLTEDSTGGTGTGALGTFLYAAPESLEDASRVDARADIYSLGVTVLFVLYGKELPSRFMENRQQFIDQLSAPDAVKTVLRKAIAWEPASRFDNIAAFCDALTRALATTSAPEPEDQPMPKGMEVMEVADLMVPAPQRVLEVTVVQEFQHSLPDQVPAEEQRSTAIAAPAQSSTHSLDQNQIPPDCICISLDGTAGKERIFMNILKHKSLQSCLVDLYNKFLQKKYNHHTYGLEWMLVEEKTNRVLIDVSWLLCKDKQSFKFNRAWSKSVSPAASGLTVSSRWFIVHPLKPAFAVAVNKEDLFAVALHDKRRLRSLCESRILCSVDPRMIKTIKCRFTGIFLLTSSARAISDGELLTTFDLSRTSPP